MPNTSGKAHLQNKTCYDLTLNRKADGLIVALTGNLERPLVGQTGTFLEPGSANLISFSVEILGHNFTLKQKSLKITPTPRSGNFVRTPPTQTKVS